MPSYVKYTQSKNDVIYFQSYNDTYLTLTLLFHLILTHMSWLQPRKEGLHFIILSDNNNYDFNIKVGRCRFLGFVNNVIDYECLECKFCFRIKETEKDTFYINFYYIIFLQSCFFTSLLLLNNYNGYMCAIYNCCFYNELITNNVL